MIRVSEMVLPGHPDKFCDAVAEAVVAECLAVDPDAYCQIEVGVWSDQVWLSGGTGTRVPLRRSLEDLVIETGLALGYTGQNHIDARRYQVNSTVCQVVDEPTRWTHHLNDQSIVIGWAGHDARTDFMPPEHHLARVFREGLIAACARGALKGCGPDGKLIVRLREQEDGWILEHVLVTLQSPEEAEFMEVAEGLVGVLRRTYQKLRKQDRRWKAPWEEVELLLNPNGPLVEAGSDGDNGQTGRKLVMDYYGPRVPLGGGALLGKHPTHIDRAGSAAAREAAVHAVRTGADECLVRLTYAPGCPRPLDVTWEMYGRGERVPAEFFDFGALRRRYRTCVSPLHELVAEDLEPQRAAG